MECYQPTEVWVNQKDDNNDQMKKQIVPCGKCLACLSNKRNDWAFRLEQEHKRSKSAAFITLTYHPKFLPETGVSKRHFQLFMKRLRKKSGDKLRYYAVGEYGSKTGRPHYHAIIFNYAGNERFLQSIWSTPSRTGKGEPYGLVHIGKVNQATIMYTTKYVIQRVDHKSTTLAKPFALMSRRYGLGGHYLTDSMVKWHRDGARNYTLINGQKRRLCRFYKEKIWPSSDFNPLYEQERKRISDASKWEAIKEKRKRMRALIAEGYDPHAIIAETRSAVISRIKQKTAYTQII